MALAIVFSRASAGIHAPLVTVEAHVSYGPTGFFIVGLPEAAVKESRDRIRSAFMNTHFEFPDRRVTINLAPADLPKEGGRFDLPIALGILAASGQLPIEVLLEYEFTGELALSGALRGVKGILPLALGAHQAHRQLVVPAVNQSEAALLKEANVLAATHLLEVCAHLKKEISLPVCQPVDVVGPFAPPMDLADVKGQPHAKRALEIAAAGRHSLLFVGPPGTGKTMLATRLPSILPPLTEEEALQSAAIISISSNGFDPHTWRSIPFRAPHHSSSSVALVGGGRPPRPGEISLAHLGVLFLDELPEFSRTVLECLREPLESGHITISRAAFQTLFPARFQFIAAMNPCPCGYAGAMQASCRCSVEQIKRYKGKLSGPLLDRIDMQVEVAHLDAMALSTLPAIPSTPSAVVRDKVIAARHFQWQRQGKCNAFLTVPELEVVSSLEASAFNLLNQAMNKFDLSARSYHRIIKMARTIADLAASSPIMQCHVAEALNYRCFDRTKPH